MRKYIYRRSGSSGEAGKKGSVDLAVIIHLPQIDQLPTSASRDIFRQFLGCQSLEVGFACVHGISSASDARTHVLNTGEAGHFVDQVLDTETKAWREGLAQQFECL